MKSLLIALTCVITILPSCGKRYQYEPEPPRQWFTIRDYYPNMHIDSLYHETQKYSYFSLAAKGNKTVFQWSYEMENRGESDNEQSHDLFFQLDSGVTSFTYSDADLRSKARCYYAERHGWNGLPSTPVEKGIISGTKLNDTAWYIEIAVTLPKSIGAERKNVISGGKFIRGKRYLR